MSHHYPITKINAFLDSAIFFNDHAKDTVIKKMIIKVIKAHLWCEPELFNVEDVMDIGYMLIHTADMRYTINGAIVNGVYDANGFYRTCDLSVRLGGIR